MHQGVADSFLYLLDPGQDPSKQDDNTLNIFFGLDDSLGSCVKLPDDTTLTGAINSVSFAPAPGPHAVRITVTARLGKAAIPDKVLEDCDQSNGEHRPRIATVSRQYGFIFDGQKIVPARRNPPTKYGWAVAPSTSYRPAK